MSRSSFLVTPLISRCDSGVIIEEAAMQTVGASNPSSPCGSSPGAFEATITRIVERAPDTRSFFLHIAGSPGSRKFIFKPGQFLSFSLPAGEQTITRAYTIASLPEDAEHLEICLNRVPDGPGSSYLFSRKEADVLRFTGPWGTFVLDQPVKTEYVFLADRVGVVPFRSMIQRVLSSSEKSTARLLYAARRESDLLYRDEWQAWDRQDPRFSFWPILEPHNSSRASGPDGYGMEKLLLPYVEQHYVQNDTRRDRRFYICGVGRPILLLRDRLRGAGYERKTVKYEKW